MNKMLKLNQSGLTVVEVAIATVVLTVSAVVLATTFAGISGLQIGSDRAAAATALAEQKIEELRNNHYNQLNNTNPPDNESGTGPIDFSDELSQLPSAQGTIQISEPAANLKRVDVTITYTDEGNEKTVELSSVIGALGIAQ